VQQTEFSDSVLAVSRSGALGRHLKRKEHPMRRLIPFAAVLFASTFCGLCLLAETRLQAADDDRHSGLIGVAYLAGKPTDVGYRYPHGEVFPPELIRKEFHDGEEFRPEVRIELVGYVEAAKETQVEIFHAAGGVNGDHGTLYVDDKQIGQVGDDTVKNVIYSLKLTEGQHQVRWVLTGGTFQANLLKFQNADSGKRLPMYFTTKQRKDSGAAKPTKIIKARGELEGWPPPANAWTRVEPAP
jgi:hypothetical protein